MGYPHNVIYYHKFHHVTISCLFLVILSFSVQGRGLQDIVNSSKRVYEEKAMLRAKIGSRPPRCYRRCASCGPCEAIQLPTNPPVTTRTTNSAAVGGGAAVPAIAYARGDGNSNYKPMSWKCKCGNLIFSP